MNQRINLLLELPNEGPDRFLADRILKLAALFVLLLAALYGFFYFQKWQMVRQFNKVDLEQKTVQNEIIILSSKKDQETGKEVKTIQQLERDVVSKKKVIDELGRKSLSNTTGFSEYLTALSESSVRGMSVSRIDIQNSGSSFIINGQTSRKAVVLEFINNMMKNPLFSRFRFEFTALTDAQQANGILNFVIKAQEVY